MKIMCRRVPFERPAAGTCKTKGSEGCEFGWNGRPVEPHAWTGIFAFEPAPVVFDPVA
jgi:hypothetical protein